MPPPSLLLLLAAAALAEDPELPPAAVQAWQAMSVVQRLEARFEQIRTTSLLAQPLVSTGTLRFQRPDRLAWQVESPGRSLMVMDGSKVGMWYPDLDVREEIDLSGDPDAARLVGAMMVWLAGDLSAVAQSYRVAWSQAAPAGAPTGTLHAAVLTPRDATMAALVSELDLFLGGEPLRVLAVTMREPDGDRVEITMRDVRLDPELPAGAFSLGAAP
ncbi:MAG: outer membrane lipoprotein carrier protein LolA [Pseudomonadota bacterium]